MRLSREIGSVEAHKLKAAGVTAYNHNLDTSPFYPEIVSTHTISGPPRHHCRRAGKRYVGLLWRDRRYGGNETRRLRMPGGIGATIDPDPDSVPINWFNADAGHATGRFKPQSTFSSCFVWLQSHESHCRSASSPGSWTHPAFSREGQALCFFQARTQFFTATKLLTAKKSPR